MSSSAEHLKLEQRLVGVLRQRLQAVRLAPQPPIDGPLRPTDTLAGQSPYFAVGFTPVFNHEPPHDLLGFLTGEGRAIPAPPLPPSSLYDPSEVWVQNVLRSIPVREFQRALLGSPTPTGEIDLGQPLTPVPDPGKLVAPWDRAKAAAVTRWLEAGDMTINVLRMDGQFLKEFPKPTPACSARRADLFAEREQEHPSSSETLPENPPRP
jgi:hypothetical protein